MVAVVVVKVKCNDLNYDFLIAVVYIFDYSVHSPGYERIKKVTEHI